MRRSFLAPVLAASLLLVLVAGPAAARPATTPAPTIASTAINAGSFETLVTALICTELVDLVNRPAGPQLTVFAPTDAAFAELGLTPDTVCDLDGLAGVLADHVVVGRYPSGRVLANDSLTAFSGRNLSVADDLAERLDFDLLDLRSSNGVIHVLDEVIFP